MKEMFIKLCSDLGIEVKEIEIEGEFHLRIKKTHEWVVEMGAIKVDTYEKAVEFFLGSGLKNYRLLK